MKIMLTFALSAFCASTAFATQSFELTGKLIFSGDHGYVIGDGGVYELQSWMDEAFACDVGTYELVKSNPLPASNLYNLIGFECESPRSQRFCPQFVHAHRMFHPESGDCALAGDGCAVEEFAELGYRNARAGECTKPF